MHKTIVAFGASNHKDSINQRLAKYAASRLHDVKVIILDLNDFEMPIFSIDREKSEGIPEKAHKFHRLINEADGIIISFAEYNGTYSSAFKNIYDWISRLEGSIWGDKPVLALATSPGKRGGSSVLEHANTNLPRRGAQIKASFSLPSFNQNFSSADGITEKQLLESFNDKLDIFVSSILENTAIL